jgi:Ca2+-binding RTX toxin-like protein
MKENRGFKMKILSIAVAVALSTASYSALAKDAHDTGAADNAIAVTAAAGGTESAVIGTAIEGSYSSQAAVSVGAGTTHWITGTGGNHWITGTGGNHWITGTGGNHWITGTGGNHWITGTGGNHWITGTGGNHWITGTGGNH